MPNSKVEHFIPSTKCCMFESDINFMTKDEILSYLMLCCWEILLSSIGS